jgi:hypothetical protein
MQQHLEAATASFFGDDLRIRKMWKNREGYRQGKSKQGFRGSALIAEVVDDYGQARRSCLSGGFSRCVRGRMRPAERNDDLDHLGWLPGTLIIEADEAWQTVPRDAAETVGASHPIELKFECGD